MLIFNYQKSCAHEIRVFAMKPACGLRSILQFVTLSSLFCCSPLFFSFFCVFLFFSCLVSPLIQLGGEIVTCVKHNL